MIKYYVIGVLAFLLLCGGFWAQHTSLVALRADLGRANAQIEAQNVAYVALSARTDAIQKLTAAADKAAQENRHALEEALLSLPDRGSRSTPTAVVTGLCKALKCRTNGASVESVQPAPR